MAYVVFYFKEREVARRKLDGPTVIGRASDSNISVRDILLSRHHCRIEPSGLKKWVISDLGSKNGTRVGDETVSANHPLYNGDVIRMGRITVRFFTGAFVPAKEPEPAGPIMQRPSDPFEALSGTVSGFELEPRGPARPTDNLPTPKPSPPEPVSYQRDDVHNMLTGLASSSWDSIYDHASRADPMAGGNGQPKPRLRPREPGVDLALQLRPEQAEGAADSSSPPSPPHRPGGRIRALLRRLAMIFQLFPFLFLMRQK